MPSEITFPDPSGYTETPWTDPNGKQWIADSKGRWSAYKADTGGGGAWDDITGIPAPVEALTGTNTGDQDLSGLLTISTAAITYAPISTTVTLAGTQTLTNKSISAGQITGLGAFATSTDASNLTGNIARARIDNALSGNAAPIVATTVTASANGAASTPAVRVSGVPFAGTGTTSFPLFYINDANATASSSLSSNGAYLGINGNTSADLINAMKNGATIFKVRHDGGCNFSSFITLGSSTSRVTSTANGKFQIANGAVSAGVTLDASTDGTLNVRNKDDNAAGNVTAGNLTASGTVTASGAVTIGGGTAITTSGITGAQLVAAATPAAARTHIELEETYLPAASDAATRGNNTLADDPVLAGVALAANSRYHIRCLAIFTCPTTAGIACRLALSAAPSAESSQYYGHSTRAGTLDLYNIVQSTGFGGTVTRPSVTTSPLPFYFDICINTTAAITVALQYSQVTTDAGNPVTRKGGSWISVKKLNR